MRIAFIILIALHGLIHLLGFLKAFHFADIKALDLDISRMAGVGWLLGSAAMLLTSALLLNHHSLWWIAGFAACLLSQMLLLTAWQDARFGTIPNLLLLLVSAVGFASWHFRQAYIQDVQAGIQREQVVERSLLTEKDIAHLPEPVQAYLRYTQSLGKPKVTHFKVVFTGKIRKDEKAAWMPFRSEQHNFMALATRLFFMNATMKGMPVAGYHRYHQGAASMDIRLFSLVKVQYQSGREMDIAETVTFFNDMCFMAPATLIDPRIQWLEVDDRVVTASFTRGPVTIKAKLQFDAAGRLMDFYSADRYAVGDDGQSMQRMPWRTPSGAYREIKGYRLSGQADAIYQYPRGEVCYGTFTLGDIEYNVNQW